MSNTPVQEHPAQGLSSGSGQTLPSRPLQPTSDPSASKRVCFYKSGDYKFSGHRMVINARTFKTFDALLDALSKKVPLPFGVRTITTPRGTHLVKGLDDLHDGGAYVCSDQRRVKPLNLVEVNRRQVPWNTTRPLSAGRRRRQGLTGRNNEAATRPSKVTERAAVRTPKRLVVIKNRDPTVKRTIVLQRRTAPTFDALLDYLSQILQFPVLKLYSTDGRRVDGLAALILCSGVVVAAGNEPFRLGNYNVYRTSQMAQAMLVETVEPSMLQPRAQKNKSFSSGRGSRNFSLSSERYIVNQINKSQSGSMNGHLRHHNRSFETEIHQPRMSMETCEAGRAEDEHHTCVVPHDDDIEKSFRVNQDGSMTVEMKVRLTIKEEEMLHWTTTLSRSSLSKRTVCASVSESGNSSPDSNNAIAKDSSSVTEDETKEENYPSGAGKAVGFNDERAYDSYTTGISKASFKRTPTPGPRHVNKKASVESVKTVTESGVQESLLGHYSYMERTADGETTEGYCVLRHSSSSSNKPIPKPRKTPSAGTSNKCSNSSIRSSGVAEVLQIQNNGMEVTETVMHIYESQGCYDNYFANEEYSADGDPLQGSTPAPESKPSSDAGSHLSSNDCDIDCSWQPPTADSLQRQKEEMLSLSSEPRSVTQEIPNNLSSLTEKEAQSATNTDNQETVKKDAKGIKKKKMIRPGRNQKSSTSTSSTDRKTKESTISPSKNGKHSSTDRFSSDASMGKKASSDSGNVGQKSKGDENSQSKKSIKAEKMSKKGSALLASSENVKRTPPKRQSFHKAASDNGHNVNTATGRPQMKKNMSDILQTKKTPLLGKKSSKPKSMIENKIPPPQQSLGLTESVSMPSVNPSPSEIHQYVENWLEKVRPDAVPYSEEASEDGTEPRTKVVFKIGADSESDEKTEGPTYLDECYPTTSDLMTKSSSCLSVPHSYGGPATAQLHGEQKARGLCVSMPNVRVDHAHQESTLRSHKSAEAMGSADDQTSSSNILSPKAKIKPVLRQLCSSIQCIRRASDTNNQQTTSNLEKSNSLPDFPTQVASVFGSSCKAFLSFLSVMTLRDSLKSPVLGESSQSASASEAMLMMESLQKVSAIEDEEEQRASLTDLQSRASSQFRERWKNFQILRERLESEPLSPKVSETEFALDVVSEGGDVFEDQNIVIDELMDELNMPQELRAEITSTIQQAFYPVEESTFLETDKNQSDSEEDVEQFVKEDETCISDDITETKQNNDDAEIEPDQAQELQTELEVLMKDQEMKTEEKADVVEGCGQDKEADTDGEGQGGKEERERENEAVEEEIRNDEECEQEEGSDKESGEKVAEVEGEVTADEEEAGERLEEKAEETEEGLMGEEEREVDSVEDTDEREGDEETEEDEKKKGTIEERQSSEEEETEKEQRISKGVEDDNMEETGEEEDIENINEEAEEEEEPEEEEEEESGHLTKDLEQEEENINEETEDEEEEEKENEHMEEEEGEELGHFNEENKEEEEEELGHFTNAGEEEVEEIESEEEEKGEEDKIESITQEMEEEEVREEGEEEEEEGEEEEEEGEEEEEVREEGEEEEEGREEEQEETCTVPLKDIEDVNEEEEEREEINEDDEEKEKEEVENEDEEDVEDKNTEEKRIRAATDEDEEEEESDEEEDNKGEMKKADNSEEEELEEEKNVEENEENTGQCVDDEEERDNEEELNEVEEQSKDEAEEGRIDEDSLSDENEHVLEEASYLQQHANAGGDSESPSKLSSEGQCADDKGNGTELETDEGAEQYEQSRNGLSHPVEISQELLDFVNHALQSSSLIFTYDPQGNIRIEPDYARVIQTKQMVIPKRKDSSYGLKCLPSPSTSDLSDYRPETSESGGYKTQESVDIVSESGEEASEKSLQSAHRTTVAKSAGSFSSSDSGTKASKDLSYFSAASSLKADAEAAPQPARCTSAASENDSADGVLIDKGRWLLKENHLIRKSPPVSLGMYGHLDSSSVDTGQENTSEDSPPHYKTQHSPLAAISSSELEEMAKPLTPKCTYYNMPHGSDSDPFMDDSSIKSGKKDSSRRGVRVSPTVDTSKTWANKNGSLSSFASVEFKIQDRKVHPEGEPSSTVTQPRRTSSGGGHVLQSQDSLDTLHVRCGQYCPIL